MITQDKYEMRVTDALNMVTSGVADPEQWLIDALGGSRSRSGERVNTLSALGLPVVWNSVNLIAGHIAAMEMQIRKSRSGGGSDEDKTDPAYRLLNKWCNDLQTPFTMKQTAMFHALMEGNARIWINRDGMGKPVELILILPVNSFTIVIDGAKWHFCWVQQNVVNNQTTTAASKLSTVYPPPNYGAYYRIPDEDLIHIPGLGYNGLWGYPLVAVAKDIFGIDQSGLGATSYQFKNGNRPGLLLTAPKGLLRTEKEAAEFMQQFKAAHEGIDKAGRVGLLREGMTAQTLDTIAVDNGLSELRETSRQDLALLFGTEYLLGESAAVYKDLQARMTAYVTNTLNKWMETWEQEIERKLLRKSRKECHMDATGLIRGSASDLAEYTGKLRQQAVISANEARELHGYNPVEGLDDYSNPNTATEPTKDDGTEPEQEDDEQTVADEQAANWLEENFRTQMYYEVRRVRTLASKIGTVEALDKFYKKFEIDLKALCGRLHVDEQAATIHCEMSKDQLLPVLANTEPKSLKNEVIKTTEHWPERSKEFVQCCFA